MAITLVTKPDYYVRAYDTNTCYYKISSNQVNQTNFRFVLKLYNSSNTLLTTIKLPSDSSGYAYYNPTSYINNFLTSDVPTGSTLTKCTNSYGVFRIDFGEEYGDPITFYSGTTDSRFYYNGCQIYEDYDLVYDNNHWIVSSGFTDGHFLTPSSKIYLSESESYWLYFISKETTSAVLAYTIYSGGTIDDEVFYPLNLTGDTMNQVGIGPMNNAYYPGTLSWLSGGWEYYTIQITKGVTGLTELVYVYNTPKCSYNDWSEVYWLNEHGGWSNFIFNKRKYKDYKIKRNLFEKFLGYGYSIGSRGQSQYLTEVDTIYTLNTDWINDQQNLLIRSLLFSPDVRILENGKLIPYIVIDSEYNEKNVKDDGLYSYQVKMIPATKKIIQRG